MLHTVVQTSRIAGHHLSEGALIGHRPFLPMSATTNDMSMRDGGVVSTPADPGKFSSAGVPTLEDTIVQNNGAEAALGARLASVDIYAVGALLHSLNLEFRESARLDRQAARDCDIAAQSAAAKALRASGLCQLVGTVLTSTFAIAGAGVNLKGASKAQARFQKEVGDSTALNKTSLQADLGKRDTKLASEPPQRVGESPGVDPTSIQSAQLAGQQTTMIWSSVATGITEVGKLGGAGSNMGATIEQEKKAKLEAEGTKMRSRAEDESEFKSAYEKMIQDVLEKLSEVRRAEAETMSKIANMG
ncbi:hypothetical protein SAMN04488498_1465 [Mesorhizobium albiziae]|uniref:Uncharacterized protein n=1 Tax=Neomesorhizobium albiziae TaxID=335020 RepID=A0A1I4FG82_9HYPH|nr:hypothetical protein [Mesorhizobium albiziae]GLS33048.1 hypothetical protein GCM10007937_47580 [Mesorhizobium albiziae]SFL16928.1 hypothetical protein SAMN04488498_1465 [Mesorhizobium albiziae]